MRTHRPTISVVAAIACLVLLTACGQQDATDDGTGTGAGGSTPDETTTPDAGGSTGTAPVLPSPSSAPQSVVDQSIALLAEQLGVPPDQIQVASAVEVTWRDGSIGCAKKDMAYTQALVPGALVELVVDGTTYAFHQGAGAPFYCADPTDPLTES